MHVFVVLAGGCGGGRWSPPSAIFISLSFALVIVFPKRTRGDSVVGDHSAALTARSYKSSFGTVVVAVLLPSAAVKVGVLPTRHIASCTYIHHTLESTQPHHKGKDTMSNSCQVPLIHRNAILLFFSSFLIWG